MVPRAGWALLLLVAFRSLLIPLQAAGQMTGSPQTPELATLERQASGPSVDAVIAEERRHSHRYGGRSIFGAIDQRVVQA